MRDIKFRAFIKKTKMMVDVIGLDFDFDTRELVRIKVDLFDNPVWFSIHEAFLIRQTGLKDKNGKEIYEGDIVKYLNGSIKTIEWYENGFYLSGVSHTQFSGDEVEVMGNSHEKPEQPEEHVNP